MMKSKKYLVSGLLTSLVMFLMSCFWHGVVLNDFMRVSYPMPVFLSLMAMMYVVISLIMLVATRYIHVTDNFIKNGIITGTITGGVVFLIALVLGLSFSSDYEPMFIMLDLSWQLIEQTAGAVVMAKVYHTIEKREAMIEHQ